MNELFLGKGFTYIILSLYGLRAASYAFGHHWGPMSYWVCAFGITVSAEFLITKFP